ncbi:MAG: serine protease [Pseudolabrys sp.]
MRRLLMSMLAMTALGAAAAAAQDLDNNGRYIPQVEKEAAPAPQAEPVKPKKSATKPAEQQAPKEKPEANASDRAAADAKEPVKKEEKKEAKANAKAAAKTEPNDPLADIPFSQRAAVRAALLWAAGEDAFRTGDQIAAAIDAFRKRNKSKASGTLTGEEREMLLAAAREREQDFGWTVVTDPATGIRLGLPAKMVPQATLSDQGTRWSSRHGDIQVETFRFKTDEPLNAVFARMKSEPANRKVEYSALRSDNFIISGLQGLRKYSVRAYSRDGEVRGFIMMFDQATEGIVAPVLNAMASAFAPFPARIAPIASLTRNVEYGTGIVVSAAGHIITDRKLAAGCHVVVVPGIGNAEPVATDEQHGLALLRVYGGRKLTPAAFASGAPQANDLTLVGVPDPHIQNGNGKRAELKARLNGGTALELRDPLPVAGFSGAAALDAQGRVAGMMETRSTSSAGMQLASVDVTGSTATVPPPVRLISSETIRGFLAAHHIRTAADGSDAGSNARTAVVRVICVRK